MAIVRVDSLRTLAFGGISAAYAPVGAAITHNWRTMKLTNNTNGDLFISLDGVTNNIFLPASSFTLYDLATNAAPINESSSFVLQIGTQFYAKQSTAPSSGALWIEGIYSQGE